MIRYPIIDGWLIHQWYAVIDGTNFTVIKVNHHGELIATMHFLCSASWLGRVLTTSTSAGAKEDLLHDLVTGQTAPRTEEVAMAARGKQRCNAQGSVGLGSWFVQYLG